MGGGKGAQRKAGEAIFSFWNCQILERERWRKEIGEPITSGEIFFPIIFCGHFSVGEMPPLLFKHDWEERLHGTRGEVHMREAWCLDGGSWPPEWVSMREAESAEGPGSVMA